jgi:hypothetical protein
MNFLYSKARVLNRGNPPDAFLTALVDWAKTAPMEIFAPNSELYDIYTYVKPILGPWTSVEYRRGVMMEVMRVHAGFESSWNWNEGVDHTNQTSMHNIEGQETGIFQVSFDSTYIANGRMKSFAIEHEINTPEAFIIAMKSDHKLALDYYARLIRFNVQWAGPIKRHEIDPWLSRKSADELRVLSI